MQGRAESPAAMTDLGRDAAVAAKAGAVIALVGGLGAGKTHWTKGLVAALGCEAEVTSPTFALVHEYRAGPVPVFHLDFYRLETAAEVLALGWDEYLEAGGVTIIEWADKFPELLPPETIWLCFTVEPDASRSVRRIASASHSHADGAADALEQAGGGSGQAIGHATG
ncbi:MAG: tRNA (adenosine(37)-N6)-threonylcarbamoyltransferase complex ATPase subunit type 1 TsaE [Verrucomicrobia bacterium]|nr:tRNA (adenosine(37)-N6)-threonylcarbamoyltransferase complex ATPase subunit type 1 TsaE [Verrucomicrobiota bacterium]